MKVTLFYNRNMCDDSAAVVQQDVSKLFQKISFHFILRYAIL